MLYVLIRAEKTFSKNSRPGRELGARAGIDAVYDNVGACIACRLCVEALEGGVWWRDGSIELASIARIRANVNVYRLTTHPNRNSIAYADAYTNRR